MPFIISLPLYAFLFIFLGFLLIFSIFLFIILHRIFETASLTITSLTMTILVFSISALSLFTVWYLLQGVNWQTQIIVFDGSWITNIFTFN